MLSLFYKGGILMYPLLICSVIALAVVIERGICFLRVNRRTDWLQEVETFMEQGAFTSAAAAAGAQPGPLALMVKEALDHRDLPPAKIEARLSSVGSRELKRLASRLHLLELIGKIAPMIGLSGTVLGLTRTFQTVAAVRNFTNPSLLASGIWEALITTVTGLFIGIPALVFYHLFENRLKSLSFERYCAAEPAPSTGPMPWLG